MPDAAQKVARAWARARLEKRADSGPRYNLFDSLPDGDRRGQHGGIFDSPGAKPPPAAARGQHGGIFDAPGAPAPAPRAEPAPQAPAPAPPEPPTAPQAPPPPAPPAAQAPPPARPPARPGAPNLRGLRRDRQFKQFLQEKHQGGEGKVPHPKPRLRRRYRDGIKFWTAMKHQEFHDGLMREFDAWKQEETGGETGAGRAAPELGRVPPADILDRLQQILDPGGQPQPQAGPRGKAGERVQDLGRMRPGDVVRRHDGGPKWRVVGVPDGDARPVEMQKLDADGHSVGRPVRHDPEHMLPNYEFVEIAAPGARPRERGPIEVSVEEGWRERDAGFQKLAREGTKVGRDVALGEEGQNGAVKRRMKLPDGSEHDFVFKPSSKEKTHLRLGTPDLAAREEASYEIDRLLGDGAVVPASVALRGDDPGAYQAFVPGAQSFYGDGGEIAGVGLQRISTKDLVRHPQVQRLTVLDALLGNEDRHGGNVMFSWANPDGPKTADNLRLHAIDNGYALAESHAKFADPHEQVMVVRDPWILTTDWHDPRKIEDRWDVQKEILSKIPETLHEQLKQMDPKDVAETMAKSGIKDASAIQATLVRLAVLQDNPEALGSFIGRRRGDPAGLLGPRARSAAVKGQMDWQRMSHTKPEQLLRDHTDLPTQTLDDIKAVVRRALEG